MIDLHHQARLILEKFNYVEVASFFRQMYIIEKCPLYKNLSDTQYLKSSLRNFLKDFLKEYSKMEKEFMIMSHSDSWEICVMMNDNGEEILNVESKFDITSLSVEEIAE